MYDLQLELIAPTPELVDATLHLASRYRLTFYDALYVGVAQEVGMDLVTADYRLYRRVSHLSFIKMLR